MKCLYPVHGQRQIDGVVRAYARRCGQCMSCRITRAQEKSARIRLEVGRYDPAHCWFVTLTYSDERVPRSPTGQLTLRQRDWRDFRLAFNRMLKTAGISQWSWSAVLEYGDRTKRPHVHVVIMGVDPYALTYRERRHDEARAYDREQAKLEKRGGATPPHLRPLHQMLISAWQSRGFVYLLPYQEGAASYVAHYVTKAMTKGRLSEGDDREPEWFGWSLGHGSHAVADMAERFRRNRLYLVEHPAHAQPGWTAVPQPKLYRLGGVLYPLDMYMRSKLVDALGGDSRTDAERWARIEAEYLGRFSVDDEGLLVVDLSTGAPEEAELPGLRARAQRRRARGQDRRTL